MPSLKSIAVFCGSSLGADTAYAQAAESLGQLLAAEKIGLVYGGGNIGLMGETGDGGVGGGRACDGGDSEVFDGEGDWEN